MSFSYPQRQHELKKLIQKLGLAPTAPIDWNLLDLALIHRSFSAAKNYEQLEFVGDAVVRLAAAEFLLENYPDATVGEYGSIRSVLVSDRILARLARSYGFERYLLVSASAAGDKAGEDSRLADTFEAVLGALYLSTHNLDLIRPWLDGHFQELSVEIRRDPAHFNYKEALQELTQSLYKALPEYRVQEVKKIHGDEERFRAEVWFQGEQLGEGNGISKKAAQQAAAQIAFRLLQQKLEH